MRLNGKVFLCASAFFFDSQQVYIDFVHVITTGKGFGFIECAETFAVFNQDVFLHKKEMPSVEHVGAEVQFMIMLNNKGQPQATDVQVIGQGVQDGGEEPGAAGAGDLYGGGGDFNALAGGANVFDAGAAAGGYEEGGEEPAAKRIKV